jgi:Cu(I)/Ag(I) efflux system membrane fusion protein
MERKWIFIAAGAVLGLLVAFLLPASWLFVEDAMHVHAGEEGVRYACPMFCVVMDKLPADGKCPVCAMQMTKVTGKSALDAHEQDMVGLEIGSLKRRPLSRLVRVVGEVDYDETRLARITTRTSGWLDRVWVDTTWQEVKKGDKLAAFYSPELFAAQKDLLVAAPETKAAARRRLTLLGIGAEEIAAIEKAGEASETLVLRAPRDGVVVERRAVEGAAVNTGATLYTVADLSRVWVQAEVFERDLVWIFPGQAVRLRVEGRADPIPGKVAFIDPAIDRKARTARLRIEVDNPDRALRIGQRVDAWIEAHLDAEGRPVAEPPAVHPLSIPRSAVLTTGERAVAYFLFTESDGERDYELEAPLPDTVLYEMVPLRIGPAATGTRGEQFYPVLGLAHPGGALHEGMTVVTDGNLLLDSQAQLSGKPSLLFPKGSRGGAGHAHAGH